MSKNTEDMTRLMQPYFAELQVHGEFLLDSGRDGYLLKVSEFPPGTRTGIEYIPNEEFEAAAGDDRIIALMCDATDRAKAQMETK